jgi:hypothetical protein
LEVYFSKIDKINDILYPDSYENDSPLNLVLRMQKGFNLVFYPWFKVVIKHAFVFLRWGPFYGIFDLKPKF